MESTKKDLGLPIAVIVSGLLIAGSIYATGGIKIVNNPSDGQANLGGEEPQREIVIKPVSKFDHIQGNVNADVVIVTFTDLECPFCKRFHDTMAKIMKEYTAGGKVAWVMRHFPLDMLHQNARKEAEATECVALMGGNAKFWEYTNKMTTEISSGNGFDIKRLPVIAEEIGLNKAVFEACMAGGKMKSVVQAQQDDGVSAGAKGTPYSVILAKNGEKMPIDGALPYEAVKSAIDYLLKAN